MKMQEIRQKAKQLHISSFGKTKEALIREIQLSEGNFDCFKSASDFCDQPACCFRDDCLEQPAPRHKHP